MDAVVLEKIQKIYDDGFCAVDDLSFSVQEGEIFALLGPNGAGKSTTIKVLTGLHSASSGSFSILGKKMNGEFSISPGMIGYVPQDLIIYYHLNVQENLQLFASAYGIDNPRKRVDEIIELLQLNEIRKKRVSKLSGGQKRRLNLAIGIMHHPRLLILDEPSAGMDPQSRNILWETIKRISREKSITIILTTHLMETAERLADRVAIIDHGRLLAIGTPFELRGELGSEIILEIELVDTSPYVHDHELIETLRKNFAGLEIMQEKTTIQISSSRIYDMIGDLIATVHSIAGKDAVKTFQIHEMTLEDVFLRLTGRSLREEN